VCLVQVGEVVAGGSKFAVLRFREREGMRRACLLMDGAELGGQRVRVREAGDDRPMREAERAGVTVDEAGDYAHLIRSAKLPGSKT
jgi:hypothetical protein